MSKKRDFVTHIKTVFNPVYFVDQLVGLAPYSFVDAEDFVDVSWKSNRKNFIWSVLLLIIQSVGVFYRLAINFIKPPTSILQLCSNVIHLPLVQAAGPLAVAIGLVRNLTKMRQIVRILSAVDAFLYESSDKVYTKRDSFLVVALTCSLVCVFPLYFVQNYMSEDVATEWMLTLSHVTGIVSDLQYLNLLVILKHRLVAISDKLRMIYIIDYCICREFKISIGIFKRCERRVSGTTSRLVDGNQSVFTVQNFEKSEGLECSISGSRSAIAGIILRVRQNYDALCEICCMINSIHGFTLVVNWLVAIVGLSVNLYYVTVSFVFPSVSNKVSSSTAVNVALILWILVTLFRMFVIALSCQRVTDEYRTCMNNVQRLLLEYSTEEDVLTQLVSFTDQLVNNKIEFTACGIFTMNLSVLCTFVGLVIQYSILLCQMRDSFKP
jgi:uncharacterized membrane protein YhaH (DUF805 family)